MSGMVRPSTKGSPTRECPATICRMSSAGDVVLDSGAVFVAGDVAGHDGHVGEITSSLAIGRKAGDVGERIDVLTVTEAAAAPAHDGVKVLLSRSRRTHGEVTTSEVSGQSAWKPPASATMRRRSRITAAMAGTSASAGVPSGVLETRVVTPVTRSLR